MLGAYWRYTTSVDRRIVNADVMDVDPVGAMAQRELGKRPRAAATDVEGGENITETVAKTTTEEDGGEAVRESLLRSREHCAYIPIAAVVEIY